MFTQKRYDKNFRKNSVQTVSNWIYAGFSGTIVGLSGCGKSNFLHFLINYTDVISSYMPVDAPTIHVVPVDVNHLPDFSNATFYRVILRAFQDVYEQFDAKSQRMILQIYQNTLEVTDAFVCQSAVLDLLKHFHSARVRIVLLFDSFDKFCDTSDPIIINSLRGFRDQFKQTLVYLMIMSQEAVYLNDPEKLGNLYDILDSDVCWLGPLPVEDATRVIDERTFMVQNQPDGKTKTHIINLTGGYPSLLSVVCKWWVNNNQPKPSKTWIDNLLENSSVNYRLQKIINGLTQEERELVALISKYQKLTKKDSKKMWQSLSKQQRTLDELEKKSLCKKDDSGYKIIGDLLSDFILLTQLEAKNGRIIEDEKGNFYQGGKMIESLSALQSNVLKFFINNPRNKLSKTDIIIDAWSSYSNKQGVSDDSLYQIITELRKKIEPIPSKPVYIISWRGNRDVEGGYQFFPEGRPIK